MDPFQEPRYLPTFHDQACISGAGDGSYGEPCSTAPSGVRLPPLSDPSIASISFHTTILFWIALLLSSVD